MGERASGAAVTPERINGLATRIFYEAEKMGVISTCGKTVDETLENIRMARVIAYDLICKEFGR